MSQKPGLVAVAVALTTCTSGGLANLELSATTPELVSQVPTSKLRVTATNDNGTVGKGSVKLAASGGSLEADTLTLDEFGTASTQFICAADAGCDHLRVQATWSTGGRELIATTNVEFSTGAAGGDAGMTTTGFEDAGCPAFILSGATNEKVHVITHALSFDSSNAHFNLNNKYGNPGDTYYLNSGRGVLITVAPPPYTPPATWWYVMILHSQVPSSTHFTLGPFVPENGGKNGTGSRVSGPDTACGGFEGDNFVVREIEYQGDQVVHLKAEIWAHCPDPLMMDPNSRVHGYICY